MAEERNFVELRSEEVQEILGTPPSWLVRWGTVVVLLGFGLLLGAAWFVRYPDVVASDKLSITTANPPVEVVARTNGKVMLLLVDDNDSVAEKSFWGNTIVGNRRALAGTGSSLTSDHGRAAQTSDQS